MLFRLFFVLQYLLEREFGRDIFALIDARTLGHAIFPFLKRWKLIDINASPARTSDPAPMRYICDCA
jgi:hypothetical protein